MSKEREGAESDLSRDPPLPNTELRAPGGGDKLDGGRVWQSNGRKAQIHVNTIYYNNTNWSFRSFI